MTLHRPNKLLVPSRGSDITQTIILTCKFQHPNGAWPPMSLLYLTSWAPLPNLLLHCGPHLHSLIVGSTFAFLFLPSYNFPIYQATVSNTDFGLSVTVFLVLTATTYWRNSLSALAFAVEGSAPLSSYISPIVSSLVRFGLVDSEWQDLEYLAKSYNAQLTLLDRQISKNTVTMLLNLTLHNSKLSSQQSLRVE